MSFFAELKRRKVFRVAIVYVVVSWVIMQVGDTMAPALRLGDWVISALAFFLILGFPIALVFAWAFEVTPEGIKKEEGLDSSNAAISQLAGANPILKPIWPFIDDELRHILVVAATLAQLESKNYVSTTNFVKALVVVKPGRITEFFDRLPQGALPNSSHTEASERLDSLESLESFSPCIDSAFSSLTPEIAKDEKLTSEDIYIDIARHGAGKSTRLLRSRGVSKSDVEDIVKQLGWHLVERRTDSPNQ